MSSRWLRPWPLVLGCLALAAPALAQRPPETPHAALTRPVQLPPGRQPLGAVLAELARQSRLPLSYSSSLVPLRHRYQVRPGPPRPLGVVLAEVLASEHLAYGLLDGQLVLWPDRLTPPPGSSFVNGQVAGPTSAGAMVTSAATRSANRISQRPAPGLPGNPAGQAARPLPTPAGRPAELTRPGVLPRRMAGPAAVSGKYVAAADVAAVPGGAGRPAKGRMAGRYPSGAARPPAPARPGPASGPGRQVHLSGRPASPGIAAQAVGELGKRADAKTRLPGSPPPARVTGQLARKVRSWQPLAEATDAITLLPARPATVQVVDGGALPTALAASSQPPRSRPAPETPAAAPRLRGLYLHAEGWASESLPVGVAAKVGMPRAYLLLGVALTDNGRQSGPALGLGVGTAGRARGRFTPNLDVLAWWVGTGRGSDNEPVLLLQLRPQLSWQVRRGGRLALVAGPTLSMATAHRRGLQTPRWELGRDQWLWANRTDDESLLRLWPGVQVGVRF